MFAEKRYPLTAKVLAHKTKTNKQNQKDRMKNTNDRSAQFNMFSELLLTEKLRHYLRMNATLYIGFYTLITYTFHIAFTYNYYTALKFITVHVFSFLQITSSLLRN